MVNKKKIYQKEYVKGKRTNTHNSLFKSDVQIVLFDSMFEVFKLFAFLIESGKLFHIEGSI